MTPPTLTNIRLSPNVYLSPTTEDGCIILDFGRDKVLSINQAGAVILHKIASSKSGLSRTELIKAARNEIDPSTLSRNESLVNDLFDKLSNKGLLESPTIATNAQVRWFCEIAGQGIVKGARYLIAILVRVKLHMLAALVALLIVDTVLKLIGINALRRLVTDWPIRGEAPDSRVVGYTCSKVSRTCTWYPKKALCLQRSAAAACLLCEIGASAELVIGVHKMPL